MTERRLKDLARSVRRRLGVASAVADGDRVWVVSPGMTDAGTVNVLAIPTLRPDQARTLALELMAAADEAEQ